MSTPKLIIDIGVFWGYLVIIKDMEKRKGKGKTMSATTNNTHTSTQAPHYLLSGPQIRQMATDKADVLYILSTCNPKWKVRLYEYIEDNEQFRTSEAVPVLRADTTVEKLMKMLEK